MGTGGTGGCANADAPAANRQMAIVYLLTLDEIATVCSSSGWNRHNRQSLTLFQNRHIRQHA